MPLYARVVPCYQEPEKSLLEAFRLLVFGSMVNPMPKPVYDLLWEGATHAATERREWFEGVFGLINVPIDDFEFVLTLYPEWFIGYNEAVESGEVSPLSSCPCADF